MEINIKNLYDAIDLCKTHSKYKCLIVVYSIYELSYYIDLLKDIIQDRFTLRAGNATYIFDNMSQINITVATDSSLGHRCHCILYSRSVPKNIIECVYNPFLIKFDKNTNPIIKEIDFG